MQRIISLLLASCFFASINEEKEMPTYQYECSACGHALEIMQSMTDKKFKKCPKCGKLQLHRLIGTGSGIIFKGTGFYETDYKRKDAPAGPGKPAGKSEAPSAKSAPTSSKEPAPGEARHESRRPAGKASGSASSNCCGGSACGH